MKIIGTLTFLFLGTIIYAQNDVETVSTTPTKQISVNVSNFILQLTRLNEIDNTQPEFLFYFKKGDNEKKWRHGFGLDFYRENRRNTNFETEVRINYSFGREYYYPVSKKWLVYYGWDGILGGSYLEFKTVPQNGSEESRDWVRFANLGFQGVGGLQFQIKERLSLLTEMSFGFFFSYSKDDRERENYFYATRFNHPTAVILSYHF